MKKTKIGNMLIVVGLTGMVSIVLGFLFWLDCWVGLVGLFAVAASVGVYMRGD